MHKLAINFSICIVGVLLNITINRIVCVQGSFPLYLDTILTITCTLVSGLFWGILCGALTNIVYSSIWFWGWEAYIFTICNIVTALITWQFIRSFPGELNFFVETKKNTPVVSKSGKFENVMGKLIVLTILSFCLCITMSVLGGLITGLILMIEPAHTGKQWLTVWLSATMFTQNVPVIIREILARIPINIIDRLISAFAGYGFALLILFIIKKTSKDKIFKICQ